MKKHGWALIALLACSFFVVSSAQAALIGSRHDMTTATGYSGPGIGGAGPCSYCHIPHKATGAKAWAAGVGGTVGVIGIVGQLCYDCHAPGQKFSAAPTVTAVNVFDTGLFHGLTRAQLPAADNMAGSGLPYATTALTAGLIECSSCHDPHNTAAGQDPFLQAVGTDMNTLCTLCHGGRSSSGVDYVANTLGTHPVNIAANSGSATSPVTVPTDNMARAFRYLASVAGTGDAWLAGGHLSTGATGNVTCNTCHAIHGRQPVTTQNASVVFTDNSSGSSVKALLSMGNGLVQSGFCEACHGSVTPAASGTANVKGPGGTGTFSHPINVTGGTVDTTVFVAAAAPYNYGTNKPICRSCHGVHPRTPSPRASVTYTPILYERHNPASGTAFCRNCHPATGATFFESGKHHAADTANWGDIASMQGRASGATPPFDNSSWFLNASGTASAPAGIVCYNCHRVHNSPDNVSILRLAKGPGFTGTTYNPTIQWLAGCTTCHGYYPSQYTANDNGSAAGKGSHFVGTLRNIPAGLANSLANYCFTAAWPGTGSLSIYGLVSGTITTDNTLKRIVCESCHRFDGTATTNNHSLVGNYGNTFQATGTTVGLCRTCHLTTQDKSASGADGWGTGWMTGDGRLGVIGRTHPLEKVQVSGVDVNTTKYPIQGGNVSYAGTTPNRVNCESCHAGHGTYPGLGAMILEGTTGTANYSGNAAVTDVPAADGSSWFPTTKNEAGFCLYCHVK